MPKDYPPRVNARLLLTIYDAGPTPSIHYEAIR
jgi:hypothetical protein